MLLLLWRSWESADYGRHPLLDLLLVPGDEPEHLLPGSPAHSDHLLQPHPVRQAGSARYPGRVLAGCQQVRPLGQSDPAQRGGGGGAGSLSSVVPGQKAVAVENHPDLPPPRAEETI